MYTSAKAGADQRLTNRAINRFRFRTWVTGLVQYIGNTLQKAGALRDVLDALEREPKNGPKNGVCDESVSAPELSGVVP